MPKIVFWNLNAKNDSFPVKFDTQGTSLVSGFSPALLTNILNANDLTPISMMLSVVDSKRYSAITI
jgi:hypothetical protein